MSDRLCPSCNKNEVPPRCRKCAECVGGAVADAPVTLAMVQPITMRGDAFAEQLAVLAEARELGLVDEREAFEMGSRLLLAACPDAFAGYRFGAVSA